MNSDLQELVTTRTGRIEHVEPVGEGYSPATTAVVTGEHGTVFVKAVPDRPGGRLEEVMRQAQISPHLDGLSPALLWQARDRGWYALGFEVLTSRPSDFTSKSPDLPLVVQTLDRINELTVPEVAAEWWETRWDEFLTKAEQKLLRGDHLAHTDLHPHNLVVGREGMWVLDWAWPTRASAVVTPSTLAVQLVSAGQDPGEVEKLLASSSSWGRLDQDALVVFARADAELQTSFAERWPEAGWMREMADAAKAWHSYLKE